MGNPTYRPGQTPQTGNSVLDTILMGAELPGPQTAVGGGLKAASGARAALAELFQVLRSGKITDPDLVQKALRAITKASPPQGFTKATVGLGQPPIDSVLLQSIGKFKTPQQLRGAAGWLPRSEAGTLGQALGQLGRGSLPPAANTLGSGANVVGNLLRSGSAQQVQGAAKAAPQLAAKGVGKLQAGADAVKGLLPKSIGGRAAVGAAGLGGLAALFSGGAETLDTEPYDPGYESLESELLQLGKPVARGQRGGGGKPRPKLPALPGVTDELPEELGTTVDSTPEALEFLQGRNPTEGLPMFEGQTSSLAMLGDTALQQLPARKKNKNLMASILKGLW